MISRQKQGEKTVSAIFKTKYQWCFNNNKLMIQTKLGEPCKKDRNCESGICDMAKETKEATTINVGLRKEKNKGKTCQPPKTAGVLSDYYRGWAWGGRWEDWDNDLSGKARGEFECQEQMFPNSIMCVVLMV